MFLNVLGKRMIKCHGTSIDGCVLQVLTALVEDVVTKGNWLNMASEGACTTFNQLYHVAATILARASAPNNHHWNLKQSTSCMHGLANPHE